MIIEVKFNHNQKWQTQTFSLYDKLFAFYNDLFNDFYDLIVIKRTSMSIDEQKAFIDNLKIILNRFKKRFHTSRFLIKDNEGNDCFLPSFQLDICLKKLEKEFNIDKQEKTNKVSIEPLVSETPNNYTDEKLFSLELFLIINTNINR